MDSSLQDRLLHAIGKDQTRKALLEYFKQRGFDPLTMLVYPPAIMDITEAIPALDDKVVIKQSADDIDPTSGVAKIRWDLFVEGFHRMCLGQTTHTNLADVAAPASPYENMAKLRHTAKEIVEFIVKILDNSKTGFERKIAPNAAQPMIPTNKPKIGPTQSGGYYERNKQT